MTWDDRYGRDVLADDRRARDEALAAPVAAAPGLVVEEAASGYCGAVLGIEAGAVRLEDRHGRVRLFPLGGGFLLDGEPVVLTAPRAAPAGRARTASGSFAVGPGPARVARAGRIFVEGRHDAELVERVWGDDLRVEGVVVELLDGVDNLAEVLAAFGPGPGRRAGVLVDHLVPGSKESRVADAVRGGPGGDGVLIVGHPFVDVWQAVKPGRLGLDRWPEVPRSVEWKRGVCAALGRPHASTADVARAWRHILGRVRGFADLEPAFLGRVEELIDFVTAPPGR